MAFSLARDPTIEASGISAVVGKASSTKDKLIGEPLHCNTTAPFEMHANLGHSTPSCHFLISYALHFAVIPKRQEQLSDSVYGNAIYNLTFQRQIES